MQSYEQPVAVFINPEAGSSGQIMPLLQQDKRLEVHAVNALGMVDEIRKVVATGAKRILVSGGDGTLALAGGVLAETGVAMGVIPGGTLNHFAARMGIPLEPQAAIELALSGKPQAVDVGFLNDRMFLNTSSVGAYVRFVRTREYLEQRMSYQLASLLAGIRRLFRLRSASIRLDGCLIRTPLVFVGVGERELGFPVLGQKRTDGRDGLHLIVLKSRGGLATLKLALNAMIRGIDPLTREQQIRHYVTDALELYYRRKHRHIHVALDGELMLLKGPLRYRYGRDALSVIISE